MARHHRGDYLLGRLIGAVSIIALGIIVTIGLINLIHKEQNIWHLVCPPPQIIPKYKVAIFLGADVPALRTQRDGIVEAMNRHKMNFQERTYFYDQNQALLTHQIISALDHGADLLVTVGTIASQTAHRVLQKSDSKAQLVFSCVLEPVTSGLSATRYYTGANSTGFSDQQSNDMTDYVRAIKCVRPDAKKALIVYSANVPMLEAQHKAIKAELIHQGIDTRSLEVFSCGEVYEKARQKITNETDLVIILRDYSTTAAIQALLRLCRKTKTTLFAADKHSVEQGAAAAFSVDEFHLGLIIGHYLHTILEKGIPARRLPITYLVTANLCRLHINPFVLEEQGITVPLEKFMSYDRINILNG